MKLIAMGLLACVTIGLSGCGGPANVNNVNLAAQMQQASQRQAAHDARKAAADAAADAKHEADVQKMMNSNGSDNSFIPKQPDVPKQPEVVSPQPVSPTSGNCTSTTTSQSAENAGSSTTTTTCSN